MEIKSLKDWSTALEEQSKVVAVYERKLTAFYKNLKINPDYNTPFMTGCYNKEKFSLGILRNLPKILFSSIVGSIIAWIVSFIYGFIKNNDNLTFSNIAKNAIIPAIIVFLVFLLINILIKFLIHKSYISSLSKMEKNLSEFLTTVPMNYRTSEKMRLIALVYFTKPTINPAVILDCVNDFLKQNGYTIPYTSVMFDLPCNCPFLNIEDSAANGTEPIVDTKNLNKKKNEYLPKDIDTKIFEGAKDSNKELQAMIGLDSVKDQIEKFKNRIKFFGKDSNNGCHLAFLGSAGTGKTTVARIVTKILYDLGYIKDNQYIEISGDYLCAGDTSRAMAIIEYAYGGVLFIDEAYLMEKRGTEVIGALLKAMEDHRKDFVCILAGYEEQMTRLFATNEGFTSRVKYNIYFPDYTEDEMLDIFNYFIKDYNGSTYKLSDEAIPILKSVFSLEKKSKSFGNARTVRNAVDAIMDNYVDRVTKDGKNNRLILSDDVQLYAEERKNVLQHELKNSSAADQVDESIIRLSELKPRLKNGSVDPDTDFSRLIGLDSFKKEIDILKSQKEFYGQINHQTILFEGDDGCGKSTLTKILTGYLYQLGYITENKYLEIPAELLKGSFVGHTAKRAQAIISYASGGVLYIKNYNMLIASNDSFSNEAISAINTALTENKDVTIVLGDYKSPFIDSIKNLFTIVYEFPTYSNEQLLQIFDTLVAQQNFTITDNAREEVWSYLNQYVCRIRDIQGIFNNTIKQHIVNYNGDESSKYIISKEDLVFNTNAISVENAKEIENAIQTIVNTARNESVNNTINLQVEVVPDNITPTNKPKIKLNIKPKQ